MKRSWYSRFWGPLGTLGPVKGHPPARPGHGCRDGNTRAAYKAGTSLTKSGVSLRYIKKRLPYRARQAVSPNNCLFKAVEAMGSGP
jgi:hypothetical protein